MVYLPFPARALRTSNRVNSKHRARYPRTRSRGFTGLENPNNDAVLEFQSLSPVFKPFDGGLVFRVNAVLKPESLCTRKGRFKFLPFTADRDRIQFQFFARVVFKRLKILEKGAKGRIGELILAPVGTEGIDEGILSDDDLHGVA